MARPIIAVENLGKSYTIRHQQPGRSGYRRLSEELWDGARRLWHRQSEPTLAREEFWALKNVSFEVQEGEVMGIIGRNGAGKSTLLKVLSRITEPTEGRVTLRGRVASLLEVGTGFHPELTGRENIFLNGAILGMTRAEMQRKFDEIVDFAGVEQFLDTPVKRYSSGMYVRLAFAVAAHLEPEILVVDEVLAVGDAEFQKRCLGKMGEVAQGGRTVLFVSHNMSAVQFLCSKAVVINAGNIQYNGKTSDAIVAYIESADIARQLNVHTIRNRRGSGAIRFSKIDFSPQPLTGAKCEIIIQLDKPIPNSNARCSVLLTDIFNTPVALFSSELVSRDYSFMGRDQLICTVERLPLTSGLYMVTLFLEVNGEITDWIESQISVEVGSGDFSAQDEMSQMVGIGKSSLSRIPGGRILRSTIVTA